MPARVDAIQFHISNVTPTLRLRVNALQVVAQPEWTAGQAGNGVAAYVVDKVPKSDPKMRVTFRRLAASNLVNVTVRTDLGGVLAFLAPAQQINFGASQTAQVDFALDPARFQSVTHHVDRLHFDFTAGGVAATEFSDHDIFVVLAKPGQPWGQAAGNNSKWPWVEVLRQACVWADGAANRFDAQKSIAKQYFASGNAKLTWDPVSGFVKSTATGQAFRCTLFLDVLNDPQGEARANCLDSATVVSTFANSLGCDLKQRELNARQGTIDTNDLILHGSGGPAVKSFVLHEIALGAGSHVWDGLLQLDTDPGLPVQFEVPANMALQAQYRPAFARNPIVLRSPASGNRPVL